MNKDQFRGVAQKVAESGTRVTNVHMEADGDDKIRFGSTVTAADGTVTKSSATGTLLDGQIVRVEPR